MTEPTQDPVLDIHFLSPDEIQAWLDGPLDHWVENLEPGGVSLLEHLVNDVTAPGDPAFALAQRQTEAFLARLDDALKDPSRPLQHKLAATFGLLMSYLAEAGPYRFETRRTPDNPAIGELLDAYRAIRLKTLPVAVALFRDPVFDPLREAVDLEIIPMLESLDDISVDGRDDRYMPFRVLLVAALAEQIRMLRLRVDADRHPDLDALLAEMFRLKYMRFGTSGYRGVWGRDFTEHKAKIISQAICDFLKLENMPAYTAGTGEDLSGRVIVIGYDGRRTSPQVGRWVAEVCLANGFSVYYASRPTPTPALNYFAREFIGRDRVAGLINSTASHNPPEWQGIKFNPKEGYPAPTSLTDVLGPRATIRQLLDIPNPSYDLAAAEAEGRFQQFDTKNLYLNWVRESGQPGANNNRLSIDLETIRRYFADKLVVIDPMYGSGREYLPTLLGELGLPNISIHDERDEDLGLQVEAVRGIPHLQYANPEPDFIQPLVDKVKDSGAALGLGMDTDADRFGIVDSGGRYIRPNQILAMLTRYLGIKRGETGRVIITQTGLPMIDAIAGKIPGNDKFRPPAGTIPAYIDHPFYQRRLGNPADVTFANTFVVPVGIKYIIDVSRVADDVTNPASAYIAQSDAEMPPGWMERMLIGGEESSGLTTRGHVPDKDGVWANLLVMDMLAAYGLESETGATTLTEIWQQTIEEAEWPTYGGRMDLDATTEAKESILTYYLDVYHAYQDGQPLPQMAGLEVYYTGGIRYDLVEIFLRDETFGRKYFLRVRASGTEPILRVYVESARPELVEELFDLVLDRLDTINAEVINKTLSLPQIADVLAGTRLADGTLDATRSLLAANGWDTEALIQLLNQRRPHVESRNVSLIENWVAALSA